MPKMWNGQCAVDANLLQGCAAMSREGAVAKDMVEAILQFVERVANRTLKFSAIMNLNTGKTQNVEDRIAEYVQKHLDAAYAEGLREALDCAAVSQERCGCYESIEKRLARRKGGRDE